MKAGKVAILILAMVIFTSCISYSTVNEIKDNPKEKIIMVVINRVDFLDLYAMDQGKYLIDHGFIGLANTRVSGRNSQPSAYATVGWGTRAEASRDSIIFHNVDDEIKEIYQRRTGMLVEEEGIVNLYINQLQLQNYNGEFNATPGALGEILAAKGYLAAVIGNSDTPEGKYRDAGLIAMNNKGYIPYGDVSRENTLEDPTRPYGLKTDYEYLFNSFLKLYPDINLMVVETGDMNRLEAYKSNLTQRQYQKHKEVILKETNEFLSNIISSIDFSNTTLMLVVPYPSDKAALDGNRLTPLVVFDGGEEGGILSSSTTRRRGIVGNIDIAPSILGKLGLRPEAMTGRIIQEIPQDDNMDYLMKLNKKVVNTSIMRYRVLYSFAVYEMLASVAALLAIMFKSRLKDIFKGLIKLILLATIIPPFVFLMLPLLGYQTIVNTYLILIGLSALLVTLIYKTTKGSPLKGLIIASGITITALLLDIVTGQSLIKQSIMGYDPIIGARYYGIGNEYAGILLGCSLVSTTALVEINKRIKAFLPIIYIALIIILGFSSFGANVGATITAIFAYSFVLVKLFGGRVKAKVWLYILLVVITIITVLALIDLFFVENSSHLAGAVRSIIKGGPSAILQIITRKIAMNIRVMGVTIWSRVLLIAIGVLAVVFYKPVGHFRRIADAFPSVAIGWSGILVACVVGFLVNDSGVVTAAMAAIYLTTSILYLVLNNSITTEDNQSIEGSDLIGKK